MITLYPVLRQRMREHRITDRQLTTAVRMNTWDFRLKMWGIKQWELTDVVKICGFFSCPDGEHLFQRNNHKQQFLESQGENYHV